jgi:hypothetical protein
MAMKTYSVEGLSLEAPESGVVVEKCGLKFHRVKLVGADPEAPTAWFDLVVSSKEATERIPGDKMQYFKMTFLGAQDAPTKRSRGSSALARSRVISTSRTSRSMRTSRSSASTCRTVGSLR